MRGAESVSSYQPIDDAEKFRVEYWELEEAKLRRRPAPPSARRTGRVRHRRRVGHRARDRRATRRPKALASSSPTSTPTAPRRSRRELGDGTRARRRRSTCPTRSRSTAAFADGRTALRRRRPRRQQRRVRAAPAPSSTRRADEWDRLARGPRARLLPRQPRRGAHDDERRRRRRHRLRRVEERGRGRARRTSRTARPRPTRPTRCGCWRPSSVRTASASTACNPDGVVEGSGIFARRLARGPRRRATASRPRSWATSTPSAHLARSRVCCPNMSPTPSSRSSGVRCRARPACSSPSTVASPPPSCADRSRRWPSASPPTGSATSRPIWRRRHERDLGRARRRASADRGRRRRGGDRRGAPLLGRGSVVGVGHRRHALRPLPGWRRAAHHRREARRHRRARTRSPARTDTVSLHVPWDDPDDPAALRAYADELGIGFDAMNSNTFQDNPSTTGDRCVSYKFGSLGHSDRRRAQAGARAQPRRHRARRAARLDRAHGLARRRHQPSRAGQLPAPVRTRRRRPARVARRASRPTGSCFAEHKPYEPAFYSTVNADWGSSLLLAQTRRAQRTRCLVDLGHHLPNANIEQVVSRLAMVGRLGGFHFNDSKYGDDDLTVGSIHPYQFFLIVLRARRARRRRDARRALHDRRVAQPQGPDRRPRPGHRPDPVHARAGAARRPRRARGTRRTPTTRRSPPRSCCTPRSAPTCGPLVAEARRRNGAALSPLVTFRRVGYRAAVIAARGDDAVVHRAVSAPVSVTVGAVDFGASSIRVCRVDVRRRRTARRGRAPARARAACTTARTCAGTGTAWSRRSSAGSTSRPPPGRSRRSASTPGASTTDCSTTAASCVEPPISYRDDRTERLPSGARAHRRATTSSRPTGLQAPADQHDLPAGCARPRTARARDSDSLMLPELLVAPPDRRGRPASTVGEARPGSSTSRPATGRPELCRCESASDRSLLPPLQPAGTLGGDVARCPGAPRGWPRHRVGGAGRRRAHDAPFVATGTWLLVGQRATCARHLGARHSPPGSATSRARWAASGSCATSRAGGSSRSAAASGATPTSRGSSRPRRRSRPGAHRRRVDDRASSRPPTWPHELPSRGRARRDRRPRRRHALRGRVDGRGGRTGRSRHFPDGAMPTSPAPGVRRRVAVGAATSTRSGDASPRPVSTGPVEATAIGNALVAGARARGVRERRTTPRATLGRPARRSRDERPGARTTRAHAATSRHRRPRPGLRARRPSST